MLIIMGRSDPCNKEPIKQYLEKFAIKYRLKTLRVLDLGIGEGDFGVIAKNALSMKVNLTGVEIWDKYKNSQWDVYDKIYCMDIKDFLAKETEKYDIIFLIDVLEHFNKKDGETILKKIKKLANHFILLSTPITNYPQGDYLGNPYERHKYFWSDVSLQNEGFKEIFRKKVYTWQKEPKFAILGIFVYDCINDD